MSTGTLLLYVAVMAVVTYLIRMLPLVLCKKKITNRTVRSFLYYVPYAVLGAMTFPAILSSTSSFWSAIIGLVVAVTLAFFEKGLLTVALSSCAAVFVCEWLMQIPF